MESQRGSGSSAGSKQPEYQHFQDLRMYLIPLGLTADSRSDSSYMRFYDAVAQQKLNMGEDYGPEDVREQIIAHLSERQGDSTWTPPDFTSKHEYLKNIEADDSFDEVIAQACANALQTKMIIYSPHGNEEYFPEGVEASAAKVITLGRLTMKYYQSLEGGESESPRRSADGSVGSSVVSSDYISRPAITRNTFEGGQQKTRFNGT